MTSSSPLENKRRKFEHTLRAVWLSDLPLRDEPSQFADDGIRVVRGEAFVFAGFVGISHHWCASSTCGVDIGDGVTDHQTFAGACAMSGMACCSRCGFGFSLVMSAAVRADTPAT